MDTLIINSTPVNRNHNLIGLQSELNNQYLKNIRADTNEFFNLICKPSYNRNNYNQNERDCLTHLLYHHQTPYRYGQDQSHHPSHHGQRIDDIIRDLNCLSYKWTRWYVNSSLLSPVAKGLKNHHHHPHLAMAQCDPIVAIREDQLLAESASLERFR